MSAKRPAPGPADREQLIDNIHTAVRAYIEAGHGKALAHRAGGHRAAHRHGVRLGHPMHRHAADV
jgi:hypothetical protein